MNIMLLTLLICNNTIKKQKQIENKDANKLY